MSCISFTERVVDRIVCTSKGIVGEDMRLDLTHAFHDLGGPRAILKYGVGGFSPDQLRDIADFMEAQNER